MIILRLLLRFILVPLGATVALWVAAVVVLVAQWGRLMTAASTEPAFNENFWVILLIIGPIYLLVWLALAIYSVLPATIGVLISEAFAIRHWIFHVFNGALSVWIGSTWIASTWANQPQKGSEYLDMPIVIVAAGIAAGFAYWAIAGWSAGFWKPVFAPQVPPVLPPPQQPQSQPQPNPEVLPRPPAAQA